jgi:hypothetical protein
MGMVLNFKTHLLENFVTRLGKYGEEERKNLMELRCTSQYSPPPVSACNGAERDVPRWWAQVGAKTRVTAIFNFNLICRGQSNKSFFCQYSRATNIEFLCLHP